VIKHAWVQLKYTPIIPLVDELGHLSVATDMSAERTANDEALLACWLCNIPLNLETLGTECWGDLDKEEPH